MSDEIVANGKWVLRGTAKQNEILLPIFERGSSSCVAFPWERINALPRFPVPIGWADLNAGKFFGAHEAEREVVVADAGERQPLNPHLVCGEDEGHAILRPAQAFGETRG